MLCLDECDRSVSAQRMAAWDVRAGCATQRSEPADPSSERRADPAQSPKLADDAASLEQANWRDHPTDRVLRRIVDEFSKIAAHARARKTSVQTCSGAAGHAVVLNQQSGQPDVTNQRQSATQDVMARIDQQCCRKP